jgi:hypothetical protein
MLWEEGKRKKEKGRRKREEGEPFYRSLVRAYEINYGVY